MKVELDKYSLIINGKRKLVRSGSFHYFRLPSKRLWKDRLQKIKDAGLNTVDFYFPWNYHSPKEGVYDFSGIRDVDYLMDLAENLDLYIIARPGPYICAEVDGGGFPGWLIAKKDVVLRCREKGRFQYSPEYMKYGRQWYEQIIPKIARRQNLILFQVENEYSSYLAPPGPIRKAFRKLINLPINVRFPFRTKGSQRYLKELCQLARELGVKIPIFHNDLPLSWGITLDLGGRKGVVDVLATDDYSFFGQDWKKSRLATQMFFSLDRVEKWLRPLNKSAPLFITELQGGWYSGWGGEPYENFRKRMGPEHLEIVTRSGLAQGVTLFNYYMFCGGTSWGYLGSPDVFTSYDYGAPVFESGMVGPKYEAVKKLSQFLEKHEQELVVTEEDKDVEVTNKAVFYKARKNPQTGTVFVFLRNLSPKKQTAKINLDNKEVAVPPFSMPILVFRKGQAQPQVFSSALSSGARPSKKKTEVQFSGWRFTSLGLRDDDLSSRWRAVPRGSSLDFDSLGFYYGFVWYRGIFPGEADKIKIDARHCFTVWLNDKLLGSYDNVANLGDGADSAETVTLDLPDGLSGQRKNVLTILVESLGHKKDFEDDAKNPRGIIKINIDGKEIDWQVRGGLVKGEKGLTPRVNFKEQVKGSEWKAVSLPHRWLKSQSGLGIYQTEFTLVKGLKTPLGLVVKKAISKANIYLNGFLVGRYWEDKGPQNKFYLPEGVLKFSGQNYLKIVVWERGKKGELGEVYLETY